MGMNASQYYGKVHCERRRSRDTITKDLKCNLNFLMTFSSRFRIDNTGDDDGGMENKQWLMYQDSGRTKNNFGTL